MPVKVAPVKLVRMRLAHLSDRAAAACTTTTATFDVLSLSLWLAETRVVWHEADCDETARRC